MINGIMFIAEGFEQVEALATQDVLRRTGQIHLTLVSINKSLQVKSSSGVTINVDELLENINPQNYDFIILPGGKVGTDNIQNSKLCIDTILHFYEEDKYLFAICAAPSIFEKLGILDNKPFVCFPGFEIQRGKWQDKGVVKTGKIITGRSMGYSIPFAEEIAKTLLGDQIINQISGGIYGVK